MLEPVRRVNVSDTVIERLTELILGGEWKPGDRIPSEEELARALEVGRSSVREALKALSVLGLVHRTNEGTFVRVPNAEALSSAFNCIVALRKIRIEDLRELRGVLEPEIAARAARHAGEQDIEEMERLVVMGEEAPSEEEAAQAFTEFHLKLAASTGNLAFLEVMRILKPILFRSQLETILKPGMQRDASAGHRIILEAVRARDPVKAATAMRQHINQVYE